jgi:hypothetical protein
MPPAWRTHCIRKLRYRIAQRKLSEQPALSIEKSVCPITSTSALNWAKLANAASISASVAACRTWNCNPRWGPQEPFKSVHVFEQTRCLGGYLSLATIEIQVSPAAQEFLSTTS